MIDEWKAFAGDRKNIVRLLITLAVLVFILNRFAEFVLYVESRQGAVLNDPVLALFNPIDVTYFTFGILYISLFTGLITLSRHPKSLILAMQAYSLLTLFRMAAMYAMPLDPPATMLPLADPLVELFGTGKLLTRDLFFSGHTSIMFILFLTSKDKILRIILLIGTISIGLLVLVQHVHYTIDVMAAPFFAWGAYSIIRKLNGNTIEAS